jgi:hypothetical protein
MHHLQRRKKKEKKEKNRKNKKLRFRNNFVALRTPGSLAWQQTGQTKTRTLALWNFAFVCRLLNCRWF